MKRIAYFPLAVIVLLGAFLALAAAQSDSLADSARAARKDKKETSKRCRKAPAADVGEIRRASKSEQV